MLEGKRTFTKVIDGMPIVSDELLAQMVGEALALRCAEVIAVSDTEYGYPSDRTSLELAFSFHSFVTIQ